MTRRLRVTKKELRAQVALLSILLWSFAVYDLSTATPYLRVHGQVKGTDFVHFYTLGRLGATGQLNRFDDPDVQRRVQLEAIPASSGQWFPPAYGPQVALFMTPFAWLSYFQALALWLALTSIAYVLLASVIVSRTSQLQTHRPLVLLAALAFVPFWSLILHGQLSVIALALTVAAWSFLRQRRPAVAGALLGLLVFKPSLAAPMFAVIALARQWSMLSAAALTAIAEVLASCVVAGPGALAAYGRLLGNSIETAQLLRAQPTQLHSWHNFWAQLLPQFPTTAMIMYALAALATVAAAAWCWRRHGDPSLRMSVLLLATVLASPHLYTYDLTLLMPAWIWLTDWFLSDQNVRPIVGKLLYVGYAIPIVTALFAVIPVQVSTICYALLLSAVALDSEFTYVDESS